MSHLTRQASPQTEAASGRPEPMVSERGGNITNSDFAEQIT